MIDFFRYLFPRTSELKGGSFWINKDEYKNPFTRMSPSKLRRIEAVQEGYVLYTTFYTDSSGGIYSLNQDSTSVNTFYSLYRKVETSPKWISKVNELLIK
jgi:hypothetical protein